MTTALTVIKRAMRIIQVLPVGQEPAAEDSADALEAMNQMMHALPQDGIRYEHDDLELTTELNMPPPEIAAIVNMLAVELAPEFERPVPPDVLARSLDGRQALRDAYFSVEPVQVDRGLLRMPSERSTTGEV